MCSHVRLSENVVFMALCSSVVPVVAADDSDSVSNDLTYFWHNNPKKGCPRYKIWQ